MKLTIDASVFVAALQAADPRHAEAVAFLTTVEGGGPEVHCPATVLVEIECAVAERGARRVRR